jgi:hypothetical protein
MAIFCLFLSDKAAAYCGFSRPFWAGYPMGAAIVCHGVYCFALFCIDCVLQRKQSTIGASKGRISRDYLFYIGKYYKIFRPL